MLPDTFVRPAFLGERDAVATLSSVRIAIGIPIGP
jgi:hypothetical protein